MPPEHYLDQTTGSPVRISYGAYVAGGQQGEVWEMRALNGAPMQDHLIKVYAEESPAVARHVREFVAYLDRVSIRNGPLSGLPTRALVARDLSQVAVLIARVDGETIDATDTYRWLYGQPLPRRLSLACQAAVALARLHQVDIVHADVAEPNVLIDKKGPALYLIDADGGGVVDREGSYQIPPVVRGHLGTWMAPELYANSAGPTKSSDNWSLAALVLKLVCPPRSPFEGLDVYWSANGKGRDVRDESMRWPQYQASSPDRQSKVDKLQLELRRLGPDLSAAFQATFDTVGRLKNPSSRTLASTWATRLEAATRWSAKCVCGQEIVTVGVSNCPFCARQVPHAVARIGRRRWKIARDGFVLLGSDVGFHDDAGGYDVVKFTRRGAVLIADLGGGRRLEFGPGETELDLGSRDGRAATTAHLRV
jgi:DNA-binding helix-hairpin-helix protein with protein kinase domain